MSERVEAYRRDQLELLASVLDRTGMYASTAGEVMVTCEGILYGLAFLEGREDEWDDVRKKLLARMDKYGIPGIDRWFEVPGGSAQPDVLTASLYAEIAHRLGYLDSVVLLDEDDWQRLGLDEPDFYASRDHRMQALANLPMPSFVVGRNTWCYAHADGRPWVFFDFELVFGSDRNPRLRDVRLPGSPARENMILTPLGRTQVTSKSSHAEAWELEAHQWLERARSALAIAKSEHPELVAVDRCAAAQLAAERSLRSVYAGVMRTSPANVLAWTPKMFDLSQLIDMHERRQLLAEPNPVISDAIKLVDFANPEKRHSVPTQKVSELVEHAGRPVQLAASQLDLGFECDEGQ